MKPILFNTQMVEAILDGHKIVTRRVIKGFNDEVFIELEKDPLVLYHKKNGDEREKHANGLYATFRDGDMAKAPYEPGDILYVRETWSAWGSFMDLDPAAGICDGYVYKADWDGPPDFEQPKWKSPVYMPKEAARIFLRVKDVRVERLWDIDLWGSAKEGIWNEKNEMRLLSEYRLIFADLWDSTIKPAEYDLYSWEANPWVWVIDFKRISKAEVI